MPKAFLPPTEQTPGIQCFFECSNPGCRLRYPAPLANAAARLCPACGHGVEAISAPLASPAEQRPTETQRRMTARPLDGLVDNLRSIHNTGAIFRTADGAGFRHLYLCGITPTPAHDRLAKTALGAELSMAWSYHPNALDLVTLRKQRGDRVWVLEEGQGAASIFDAPVCNETTPIVLVVGNETVGVDPGILAQADRVLALPMYGVKRSLNVATAFGIAAYVLAQQAHGAT